MIRRREVMTMLGGAATWPLAARAKQADKLPTIGYLGTVTPVSRSHLRSSFVERLRALGWIEGRNATIETRWAEGRGERFDEIVVGADAVRAA